MNRTNLTQAEIKRLKYLENLVKPNTNIFFVEFKNDHNLSEKGFLVQKDGKMYSSGAINLECLDFNTIRLRTYTKTMQGVKNVLFQKTKYSQNVMQAIREFKSDFISEFPEYYL